MGSGHFLITAIDWLAEQLVSLVNREWDESHGYVSPARERLWELQDAHNGLDERALLQRMVLKRCIYGVDKNPMAVELARVALWLHTFTGELPLPFLEHRIVAGDSLLGIRGEQARAYISEWGRYPLNQRFDMYVEEAAGFARQHDALLDLTLDEIRESRALVQDAGFRQGGQPTPLNLVAGLRWLSAGMNKRERAAFHAPLTEILGGDPGRSIAVLLGGENDKGKTQTTPEYRKIRDAANEIVERERVLHWQLRFPEVMSAGGFDAVIGNPPWDRIKLQEVEWWAARDEDVAKARTAAERKSVVAARRANGDPIVRDFDAAAEQAAQFSTVIRKGGDYPLLGKDDINLYSLFIERSISLLKPSVVAGLLTPSGIYADKTAAEYFRSISTTGRLGGIYDFENRRSANPDAKTAKWFPDVHPQFKFCATIAGGISRQFKEANCGFFLNSQSDLEDEDRVFPLSPEDFMRINPNTGTAPNFRHRIDAELVRRIYGEHPVLVDGSIGKENKLYPVTFHTMFHMSGDSHLFQAAEQLDGAGAYRIQDSKYRRGKEQWLPLFQGLMISSFDHRSASVGFNQESTTNPYYPIPATEDEHSRPDWLPTPHFWVNEEAVLSDKAGRNLWVLAYRRTARSTDSRSMYASIAPRAAYGDSIFLWVPDSSARADYLSCMVSNYNSLTFDYVLQRKIQGANLSKYIVEQLPMIHPDDFDRRFGDLTARELVRDHVLRLTYTAYDLTPFARDLGYEGEPFIWDPAERRQLRARLDALFFHLYGLSEDDADYILDQFPVLEKKERREFGSYLTKHLVLNQYRALAAGDTSAVISEAVASSA